LYRRLISASTTARNPEQTYDRLNESPLVENSVAPTFLQFTKSLASSKPKQRVRILLGSLSIMDVWDGRAMAISVVEGVCDNAEALRVRILHTFYKKTEQTIIFEHKQANDLIILLLVAGLKFKSACLMTGALL